MKDVFDISIFEEYFDEKSFVIRIGFGSGHLWKTIALLLMNNNKPLYDKLTDTMSKLYRKTWDLASVKLYSGSIEAPLGFVSIKVEEAV